MPRVTLSLYRRLTALHEAAHAVLAFRFGIRVSEVALCNAGPFAGYVAILDLPMITHHDLWTDRPSPLLLRRLTRDTEHRVMIYLAGPLAEAKLLGTQLRSHSSRSDLDLSRRLCRLLDAYHRHLGETYGWKIARETPGDLATRLRLRTRRLIGSPRTWHAIRALGDDLYAWSRLTGHDAADTVQWARRIEAQLSLLLPMPMPAGQKHAQR